MKNYTVFEKANYIVNMIKSVNKTLDYAIDTAAWYAMTDKEQTQIQNEIKKLWNN
jgi:uncharacterized protein Yka (UPF0111/DUF47 family)